MTDPLLLDEVEIFARTLDGEAENQGYLGQQAVANVIMKRVELQWKGDTNAKDVCLHRLQFSCWNNTPNNHDRTRILALAADDVALEQCRDIAQLALAGNLPDLTNGADSYEVTGSGAYWAVDLDPCATIGKHSFYITRKTP